MVRYGGIWWDIVGYGRIWGVGEGSAHGEKALHMLCKVALLSLMVSTFA